MTTARHIVALLQSHVAGDEERFLSVATQLAAHEARQGHGKLAQQLQELIAVAKSRTADTNRAVGRAVPMAQPRGELATLLAARYSETRLSSMVMGAELQGRLQRVLSEQRQRERLRSRGLGPRRKLLLVGPPGSGKTMTAAALAGELKLPLFTVLYDGLIGKMMGETASRLRLIFEAITTQRGVYFFDEFDAIGAQRASPNDVGEIRRVLNSFLQFLENDSSDSLIIAATNHPELLDRALFRRFDDVIQYGAPTPDIMQGIVQAHLVTFETAGLEWASILNTAEGLSPAEIARAADEAAKASVISGSNEITTDVLVAALRERRAATL
ncbi:AAA family ATPase [Acidiphilium sp. PM]|jgi:SpoVK/Ycf46/Vps4 family AAA+-type ATPase|uniref:AAA family ATPase n=1 Tax=Acidiphilium sp. PM TaxID=1043206 RepID=UPI0002144ECA|nr:ATP-binding protein [Acidiphilium sp. PM]EGO96795.1 Cell division AAA ATPase FtsH [Acidiphilium sp. PM]